MDVRLGTHIGLWTWHWWKVVPSAARRSTFGVLTHDSP
jgi:hypothetical protein